MIKWLPLLALLLAGCMSLPGSEDDPARRFNLAGPENPEDCEPGGHTLDLNIVAVGAGLDSKRIAVQHPKTGEITYLKGARWAEKSAPLVEQRLAADLECAGYTLTTSHHRQLDHGQLVCELRRFNLVEDVHPHNAEVSLSCLYTGPGGTQTGLVARGESTMGRWSVTSAVIAINRAYNEVLEQLIEALPSE